MTAAGGNRRQWRLPLSADTLSSCYSCADALTPGQRKLIYRDLESLTRRGQVLSLPIRAIVVNKAERSKSDRESQFYEMLKRAGSLLRLHEWCVLRYGEKMKRQSMPSRGRGGRTMS